MIFSGGWSLKESLFSLAWTVKETKYVLKLDQGCLIEWNYI